MARTQQFRANDTATSPPLRAAAGRDSAAVHLIPTLDSMPEQRALCGIEITGPPARMLRECACEPCAGLARQQGATFAEDRHGAMVNLRRILRTRAAPAGPGAESARRRVR